MPNDGEAGIRRTDMRYVFYALLALALMGASLASISAMAEGSSSSVQRKQQGKELPTYTPSEKVPADSAVSFPADI